MDYHYYNLQARNEVKEEARKKKLEMIIDKSRDERNKGKNSHKVQFVAPIGKFFCNQ